MRITAIHSGASESAIGALGQKVRRVALSILLLATIFILGGCALPAADPGEIVPAEDVAGRVLVLWYVAPQGSGELDGAADMNGRTGVVFVDGGRMAVRVVMGGEITTETQRAQREETRIHTDGVRTDQDVEANP